MRRTNLRLASSAVALALVAPVYGFDSDDHQEQTDIEEDQVDVVVYSRDGGIADENTTRETVREAATEKIGRIYTLLVEDLDLTLQQTEALFALLIEDRIASTETLYERAETIDKEEQSRKIAAIIGDRKLQQFREHESNLPAYGEIHKIGSLLQEKGVPLTEPQRDGLLKILIRALDEYAATPPPADESAEAQAAHVAEYERHVMELIPSVLSTQQVMYLDKQYQYLSYRRADAIERQRQELANGTRAEDRPLSFPLWVVD